MENKLVNSNLNADSPVVSPAEKQFKCDHCDYTNKSTKGLNVHIRIMHQIVQLDGLPDNLDDDRDEDDRDDQQYECQIQTDKNEKEPLLDESDCYDSDEDVKDTDTDWFCNHCKQMVSKRTNMDKHYMKYHP